MYCKLLFIFDSYYISIIAVALKAGLGGRETQKRGLEVPSKKQILFKNNLKSHI